MVGTEGASNLAHCCPKQAQIWRPVLQTGALRARNWSSEVEVCRCEFAPPVQEPYRRRWDWVDTAIIVWRARGQSSCSKFPHPCPQIPSTACPNQLSSRLSCSASGTSGGVPKGFSNQRRRSRSEEHTSELQSLRHLVCP